MLCVPLPHTITVLFSSNQRTSRSTPMMSLTPADRRILSHATPAPIPHTTILTLSIDFPTIFRALISAAYRTTAVPCWSSWNTGISSSSRSRCSISKRAGGDILQVNAAKSRCHGFDARNDLFRILGIQADREGVYTCKLFEEHRFSFHHRHGRIRADIAQTEHGASIRDDGHRISFDRERKGFSGPPEWPHTRATSGV